MASHHDLIRVGVTTAPGIGTTLTLGSAITDYLDFTVFADGTEVIVGLSCSAGNETLNCTYNKTPNTLTINSVIASSNGGSAVDAGSDAIIFDSLSASEIGTGAGCLVQLNSSAQLPAVDGSLLTKMFYAPQCGRLLYSSATEIYFTPYNGNIYKCGGTFYQIPSAAITAANTSVRVNGTTGQNLAASTVYYVSVNSSGVIGFWASSTYSHLPDDTAGNIGVEVISESGTPNSAETLIGMVYTNASAQFADACVASWFNRRPKLNTASLGNMSVSTSGDYSSSGVTAVNWGPDAIDARIIGQGNATTSNDYVLVECQYDKAGIHGDDTYCYYGAQPYPFYVGGQDYRAEGAHTYWLYGATNAGAGAIDNAELRVTFWG